MIRYLPFVLMVAFVSVGCTQGRKIDPSVAYQIQRGDTRADVESKLGEPYSEELLQDDICRVRYLYAENHGDALSWVPYVNLFAGGQKVRSQVLSIIYKDDVVQEHKFSDNTMKISGGLFNMQIREKPTPGVRPPTQSTQPSTQPK